jgi:DnaJ-class molecular chaperone
LKISVSIAGCIINNLAAVTRTSELESSYCNIVTVFFDACIQLHYKVTTKMDVDLNLKKVEQISGVNFIELREKYRKLNKSGDIRLMPIRESTGTSSSQNLIAMFQEAKAKAPGLDISSNSTTNNQPSSRPVENETNYHICKECRGQGIANYRYNHMTLSKNCEACDGEGIICKAVKAD